MESSSSATLYLSVRGNNGSWHKAGEHVTITSIVQRTSAGWDQRRLFNVLFVDGSKGAVFEQEITREE